jgi:hypothetical protein
MMQPVARGDLAVAQSRLDYRITSAP